MPFTFLNPPIQKVFLGFGQDQIPKNTAYKMRDLIRQSAMNEYVRKWAEKIVEGVQDRDEAGEVGAVFDFMQAKTRYAHDIRGTEYIQTPPYVLKQIEIGSKPSLDCDDYVVTGLSLLRSIGYETGIRIASFRKDGKYKHVFGLVKIKGQWTPFDAVRKDKQLGWEAPGITKAMNIAV